MLLLLKNLLFTILVPGTVAVYVPVWVFTHRAPEVSPGSVAGAFLCTIGGWALVFASIPLALYAGFVAACFHLFVVLYEEPTLRLVFGAGYEQYCSRVSRWLSFHHSTAG